MDEKICWTCGHYAFGCFVTGKYDSSVNVIGTCNKWCPEGTKGTVTDYEEINDGTSWAENEYLKDDESNL
ncbi:hypothetical protein ABE042_04890 [Viridibacillus arvi]|uniref:hypothetical protein n=1 Tax=Viridibacillus arvi TaxID=263475 RepID=UPI003D28CA6D